ncbi:hypothetical protein CR513_13670, partial [Mucuna pruriens]
MHGSSVLALQKLSLRLLFIYKQIYNSCLGKVKNTYKGVPRCETLVEMHGKALMVLEIFK